MKLNRILIYSDCFVYSGSENVIENILCSDKLNNEFQIRFSFAYNPEYQKRFWQRIQANVNKEKVYPLFILSRGYFINQYRLKTKHVLNRIFFLIVAIGIFLFEKLLLVHIYNIFRLYFHFKFIKPDILYINNGGYPGASSCRMAVIAAKLANIKNIVFNVNNMAYPSNGYADRLLDKFLNKNVKCFITASFAAQKQLISTRGFYVNNLKRVPNTLLEKNIVIRPIPNIEEHKFQFGSVGLLTKRKGYHILIDAARILVKAGYGNFVIQIIGDGEERSALQQQIDSRKLNSYVKLLGYKSNPLDYINNFDAFVLSSISNEDFPYVILEAMYLSKPIVGTDIAGIPEQIEDGRNGYVVKSNNSKELAEKLILMMSMQESVLTMGKNSKSIYNENFAYDQVMNMYYNLFGNFSR
jgi:glycosyltransferase involved in cell wall biosynthesis